MVVAGAALLYAYLIGFIGGTTHIPASVQVTGFCASAATACSTYNWSVTIANIGGSAVTGGITLTFQDSTNNFGTVSIACTGITFPFAAGGTGTCHGVTGVTPWTSEGFSPSPTAGDEITVTVVTADGGTAIYVTRATA